MTPEQIDRVFGCGRLQMATGEHVEVFREAVAPGERRRYTKRFLATRDGDFGPWTEREWRILARLIGHGIRCVPDVVQFDGGVMGGLRLVQTYDAGVTVDQWATLLPVERNSAMHRHIFEDCAHWWALAHYCLAALNEIHALELVHLDIKADNICIPYGPGDFDPGSSEPRLYPIFARLALIDFAFSLVSRESLATPLPIGWQKDYDYQSPRLLKALEAGRSGDLDPTKELDWRCDFYSLAAMLRRYLPADSRAHADDEETGWTSRRYDDARSLVIQLRDSHDRDLSPWRPHAQLMDFTGARLDERDLAASLDRGWMFARDAIAAGISTPITPITPVTRIARSLRAGTMTPRTRIAPSEPSAAAVPTRRIGSFRPAVTRTRIVPRGVAPIAAATVPEASRRRVAKHGLQAAKALVLLLAALVAAAAPSFVGDPENPLADRAREALGALGTHLRTQWDSVLAAASGPAPIPAPPGERDRRAASADRFPSAVQESAVTAAPTHDQDAGTAPSTSGEASTAATPSPPQNPAPTAAIPGEAEEATPATSTRASDQAAAPSTPVEAPATAAGTPSTAKRNESRVAMSTLAPMQSDATPSGAKAHAKAGAATNRSQAAKRSSPPASATSGKRPRGPSTSTAIASASGRSTPRQVLSHSAPVHSVPPPVRMAAATAAPSSPPSSTQAPSIAPDPSGAYIDSQAARSSATPSSPIAMESMSAANQDQRVSTPPAPSPPSSVETPPRDPHSAQPAAKQPRVTPVQQLNNDFHAMLDTVFGALGLRDRPPALAEARSAQASSTSRPGATSRAPAQPAADRVAQAVTPAPRAQGNAAPRPASATAAAAAAAPIPFGTPVPLTVEPFVEPAPAVALAEARTPVPMPSIPAPVQNAAAEPARGPPANNGREAWLIQARRVLAETVPRVAAEAEPDVSRVLWAAARANQPYQIPAVVEAASATWASQSAWIPVSNVAPSYARLLHNNARQALAAGRDVSAVDIELQAFGANPRDADIAGYLAFLHLRMRPVQAETARQLTLHAIAISGSQRSTRSDDWGRLAVASALTGRETDAIRAFLTEVALSINIDRTCYSALSAYATFGEQLRVPVQAMLSRVHSLGYAYPSCAFPSYWNVAARSPGAY